MHATGIDHLVLTVEDIDATCAFYGDVLGATVVTFGSEDRTALRFGDQKINLHEVDAEFDPHAREPIPGSGDFCLVFEAATNEIDDRLDEHGVEVVHGPVGKHGARGRLRSVYVRDPDGNLVELATEEETD
ncbi:VOC family protein [Halalkalicoccus subterraneus]|uniref:VOC family protein n=1 Tax=Halalkalicoccus subterraneus TaxID=2675002 RepID=UPI000EFBF6A2|nr:VOC family protein [Halalkalicoccus subterraneus]